MRLKEVTIKNFRGYRGETRLPIDPNVTGITGRNDAGKSSVLEALDIFFEGGEVALDKDDFNVNELDRMVEIRCIFDCLPPKHWLAKRIAEQFNIPWALFLDSDLGTPECGTNLSQVQALQQSGKKAHVTRKREPENYILLEVVAPYVTGSAQVTWTDSSDAKKDIAEATSKGKGEVLEFFWTQMSTEQIRRVEKYVDANGQERFELTEILSDFLMLI